VILAALDKAVAAGARLKRACDLLGLSIRTVQRWRAMGGGEDRRQGPKSTPHNKLTQAEEDAVVEVVKGATQRGRQPAAGLGQP